MIDKSILFPAKKKTAQFFVLASYSPPQIQLSSQFYFNVCLFRTRNCS